MSSRRPTGLGVAGDGLLRYFPECQDAFSETVYRFINDRIGSRLLRILFRQLATEFFAWKHRGRLLIVSTHQGPLSGRGRRIIVVHDFTTLRRPYQNLAQVLGYLFLLPKAVTKSSLVVVISGHARDELLRYLPGTRPDKVRIIPSISTRLEAFKKGGDDWQTRLKKGRFLFVGANFLHKKLDVAIEAVIELAKRGWNVGLDVVGVSESIWEKSFGFKFADLKEFGIVTKSYVSDAELEVLYSEATLLLFLSECEGLGFPPLEAMRKNCPVVCNDTPELRDTCGDAAFFADITQKGAVTAMLEQILSGKLTEEINRKVLLGNEQASKFEPANIAPRWTSVIDECSIAGAAGKVQEKMVLNPP